MMDERSYTILLQNLMNRAVDIEISDSTKDKRDVDIGKVETCLDSLFAIVGKKIVAHKEKIGDTKPAYSGKKTWNNKWTKK